MKDWKIVKKTAASPKTPWWRLWDIVRREDVTSDLEELVVQNPSTPVFVLEHLSTMSSYPWVRIKAKHAAAARPSDPLWIRDDFIAYLNQPFTALEMRQLVMTLEDCGNGPMPRYPVRPVPHWPWSPDEIAYARRHIHPDNVTVSDAEIAGDRWFERVPTFRGQTLVVLGFDNKTYFQSLHPYVMLSGLFLYFARPLDTSALLDGRLDAYPQNLAHAILEVAGLDVVDLLC